MTLERLRIFIAVAERQHVTAAARALNLTQSAVSNAIAALEAEHDVHLFDRVGRGVVLNQTGQAFLPEAKAVLARAAAAEAREIYASAKLKRARRLYEQRAGINQDELDQAQAEATVTSQEYNVAMADLELLEEQRIS